MAKIKGAVDIRTDIKNRICTFRLKDPSVDYESMLAEFAKTNHELSEYVIQ